MNEKPASLPADSSAVPAVKASGRGKYITLALLLAWVIGVFLFTLFKLPGGMK
jgi:hypothetical protein